jgi:hypothetical protein
MRAPSAGKLLVSLLCLGAMARCGGGTVQYSAALDDEAMKAIEQGWSGKIGEVPIGVSLCEDVAANDQETEDACQLDHVVKGDDRGTDKTVEQEDGVGCGGCPFNVLTHVTATVLKPDQQTVTMTGTVRLGSRNEANPYTGDWGIWLAAPADADGKVLKLEGRILATGALQLDGATLYSQSWTTTTDNVELAPDGAATCSQP